MFLPLLLLVGIVVYYVHARETGAASQSDNPNTPKLTNTLTTRSIASTPSTAESIDADLAELPKDVRDYVMSFVIDHATSPLDFDEAADTLVHGCVDASVGAAPGAYLPSGPSYTSSPSYSYSAPQTSSSPSAASAFSSSPAGSVSAPFAPSSTPASPISSKPIGSIGGPLRPSIDAPYSPPGGTSFPPLTLPPDSAPPSTLIPGAESGPGGDPLPPVAGSDWCFPKAAARLRKIAQEKRDEILAGTRGIDSYIVQSGLKARMFARPLDAVSAAVVDLPNDERSHFLRTRVERMLRDFQSARTLSSFIYALPEVAALVNESSRYNSHSATLLTAIYDAIAATSESRQTLACPTWRRTLD